jgi:translocation and assembly module TamA
MYSVTSRFGGRILGLSLMLCLTTASVGQALDQLDFTVKGAAKGLEKDLRAASILLASQKSGATDTQDLFADARAEYASLLNALYARGHYSPVIHVYVDGIEAAAIAPLDAPGAISRISVVVDPGPVFAFSKARIAPTAAGTKLPKEFAIGQTAESGVVLEAVTAGVNGWREMGHAKAEVAGQNLSADHARATLSADVTLTPGPRLRFGRLVITGQERMREARIRAIAGLPEGEVFSPEELDRATNRLRRTGVFKSVTLVEDADVTRPDLLGITATVVEQKRRRYSFAAEIASFDGLTLNGSWLHRNLFGGAERLTISGEVLNIGVQSGGVDYGLGITLDRPATFTVDTTLGFGGNVRHLDEDDFEADLSDVAATLTHVFTNELSAKAGFAYDYSKITDPAGTLTYRALSLPVSAIWDRRDVKANATKGFYLEAEAKPFLGFGITDSGARLKLDARGYKAFGAEDGVVMAARFQAGAVIGSSLLGTPRDYLFYSGGGGTVRGQPYQSLGVNVLRDLSAVEYKTGGTLFMAASAEARVKVSDTIGVVGFVDVGRVDVNSFFDNAGGWHAGAGLGVRYATAVGPIRLDLAVPVGGDTGEGLQIYVGLGQAF